MTARIPRLRRQVLLVLGLALVGAAGCSGRIAGGAGRDAGGDASRDVAPDVAPGPDAGVTDDATVADDATAADDAGLEAGPPPLVDDAEIVAAVFPDGLACGEARPVTITVRNAGTTTWTDTGYALGVDAADPFPGAAPVGLAPGATVAPGGQVDFTFTLLAPPAAGDYSTSRQMVRTGVGSFGQVASHAVAVSALPDPEAILASATIPNSPPDIASWPTTTTITRLEVRADGIYLEFSKKDGTDRWPDVTPPGWTGPIQYTLWLALNIDGQWWASGILQYWYGLDAMGGDVTQNDQIATNWVYDGRWGAMAGHQPVPGENVGFLVAAGNERGVTDGSQAPVAERSSLVILPFPAAAGAVFTF